MARNRLAVNGVQADRHGISARAVIRRHLKDAALDASFPYDVQLRSLSLVHTTWPDWRPSCIDGSHSETAQYELSHLTIVMIWFSGLNIACHPTECPLGWMLPPGMTPTLISNSSSLSSSFLGWERDTQ